MKEDKNIPYYLIAFAIFVLLKLAHRLSETADLLFLLTPVNAMIELFSGCESTFVPTEGYYFSPLNILIDKSCSGFNFWLICFLMLTFIGVGHQLKTRVKLKRIGLSLIFAYFIAILVNSARIYISILTQNINFTTLGISQSMMHEAIGILTNVTFLIIVSLASGWFIQNKQSHELTT